MNINIKTLLLLGDGIEISDNVMYKPPLLKQINVIGYKKTVWSLYVFYDPKDVIIEQEELYNLIQHELKLNYYETINYLIKKADTLRDDVISALNIHLDKPVIYKDGRLWIGEKLLDQDMYNNICNIIKVNYRFEDKRLDEMGYSESQKKVKESYIRRDKEGQRSLDRILKGKKSNNADELYAIISVIRFKKSIDFVNNSNVYQMIDVYSRIMKEKNYNLVQHAVANGNLEFKELEKHDWTKDE